jgi:hypothetical protein
MPTTGTILAKFWSELFGDIGKTIPTEYKFILCKCIPVLKGTVSPDIGLNFSV